jgi:hypothetical protein
MSTYFLYLKKYFPKILDKFFGLTDRINRYIERRRDIKLIRTSGLFTDASNNDDLLNQIASDIQMIRVSGLFDKNWYLAKNPDIAMSKIDPLAHYLRHGGFDGRDPGPFFCSRWYLNIYEDVKNSGLNPLVHYLKHGQQKGYATQNPIMDYVNSVYCPTCDSKVSNYYPYRSGKQKIFCVGHNKTGTTSIQTVLGDFGFMVGAQGEAEILMADWIVRDFRRIIEYCKTADAFQDVPFSLGFTYQIMDHAFPGSKFILTVRNNVDEWYDSLIGFYSKITSTQGIPTADDLKKYTGGGEGWLWRFQKHVYGATEETLFNENLYKSYYTNYNNQVVEYFRYRPQDLLILNLSDRSAMERLCKFLGIKYTGQAMPHLNKSKE